MSAVDTGAAVAAAPTELLIGGDWRPAATGARFGVEDPATGQTIAEVADATPATGSPRSTPPPPRRTRLGRHRAPRAQRAAAGGVRGGDCAGRRLRCS